MMIADIFNKNFPPPKTLKTPSFHLFPTDNAFYESDYIAVMNNKTLLRNWSQSSWPEDDFTKEQNKDDLAVHMEDNTNHTAYGYMIYSLDNKKCYGSVYVNPIANTPTNYHLNDKEIEIIKKTQARIDFWVIEDESDIEKEIIIALGHWFKDVWKISALLSARKELTHRIALYKELNYSCALDVKSKTSDMTLLLFW